MPKICIPSSQRGAVPIAVLWSLIVLAIGVLIGVTAYLVSQAAVALLGVVVLVIVIVYVLFPALPTIVKHVKTATTEAQRTKEHDNELDSKRPS